MKRIMVCVAVLGIALAVFPGDFAEAAAHGDVSGSVVTKIEFAAGGTGETITIHTAGRVPEVTTFTLSGPDRIVVDLKGSTLSKKAYAPRTGAGIVKDLRVGVHPHKVRVVANVNSFSGIQFETRREDGAVILHISRKGKGLHQQTPHKQSLSSISKTASSPTPPREEKKASVPKGSQAVSKGGTPSKTSEDALWGAAPSSGSKKAARGSDLWSGQNETKGSGSAGDGNLWGAGGGASTGHKIKLEGRLRTKIAANVNSGDKFEEDGAGHVQLVLGAHWEPNGRLQVVVSGDAEYFGYLNGSDSHSDSTFRLDKTYLNYAMSRFNLKLGNQIVRWGKTDGYSPLDNLNPEDFREGIASRREDRKIPVPMANLEIYQGHFTIQGIFIPYFFSSKIDLTGTDWAVFRHADKRFPGFHVIDEDPSRNLGNSEFGVRASGTARSIDYAFSWFHTREDLPTPDTLWTPPGFRFPAGDVSPLDLARFAAATGQTLDLIHPRQNIFGFEMETTLRDFGVRADVAYYDKSSFLTRQLEHIEKANWQYMLGMDYSSPGGWYANLQFYQRLIEDYDENIVWAKAVTSAFIGTFRKTFSNGNLGLGCRFYYDVSGDGTMVNPRISIDYWEPFQFEIGGEFFGGTVETPFGFYSANDQIYGLLKIKF